MSVTACAGWVANAWPWSDPLLGAAPVKMRWRDVITLDDVLGWDDILTWLFVALLSAIALLFIFSWIGAWLTARRTSPAGLFRELCRAHHLSYGDKRLLKKLAHAADVQPAVRMFLEPQWFTAPSIPAAVIDREERLRWLHGHLFDASATTAS